MVVSGSGKKGKAKAKKVVKVLSKVNKFLRKHKLISKGAKIAVKVVPKKYKGTVRTIGRTAGQLGYGRGSGLSLPGGAYGQGLRLAGAGKKRKGKKPGPKKKRKCKK